MIENLVREFKAYLRDTNSSVPFPPATEAVVRETEAALGFQIPTFLKRVYLEIGNGGFGPGYGIIGLKGGYPSDAGTLVEAYNGIKAGRRRRQFALATRVSPVLRMGMHDFLVRRLRKSRRKSVSL